MEILSENVLYGEFVFFIVIVIAIALLTLILTVIALIDVIKRGRKSDAKSALIAFSIVATIFTTATIGGFIVGPTIEYTALITDYNEVYEQGYEVLRQDGKMTILTKAGGR